VYKRNTGKLLNERHEVGENCIVRKSTHSFHNSKEDERKMDVAARRLCRLPAVDKLWKGGAKSASLPIGPQAAWTCHNARGIEPGQNCTRALARQRSRTWLRCGTDRLSVAASGASRPATAAVWNAIISRPRSCTVGCSVESSP
jgi:hypothetical protein